MALKVSSIGFVEQLIPISESIDCSGKTPVIVELEREAVASIVVFCLVFIWDLQAHGTWRVFASNALIIGGFIVGVFAKLAAGRPGLYVAH